MARSRTVEVTGAAVVEAVVNETVTWLSLTRLAATLVGLDGAEYGRAGIEIDPDAEGFMLFHAPECEAENDTLTAAP